MDLRLAATIIILSSAAAELTPSNVNVTRTFRYFQLGGGTDAAMVDFATDGSRVEDKRHDIESAPDDDNDHDEEEQSNLPEWKEKKVVRRREEVLANKAGENEAMLKALLQIETLVTQLNNEIREKYDLKVRLAEVESKCKSKTSWFDANSANGYLAVGIKLYELVAPSITPAATATTKFVCNTVVNQFVDSSTAEPICDTVSYAMDEKIKDEVIEHGSD